MSYTKIDSITAFAGVLLTTTLLTGAILMSSTVSADDTTVVDEVNVTVPISCSLSGTGMDTHNDNVNNGQYKADIGTTTLTAFCNDNNGFAIYANGYTNNEDGSNVLSNTTLGTTHDIASGIAESGDTSNWAMKLTKKTDSGDTTGTNAFTIDSAPNTSGGTDATFAEYHIVPTEYTKVAHKDSSTDMDTASGGVTLTTTYAAYINQTQAAGTYSGKVKYVLVHPSTGDAPVNADQVGVTYNGNGLTFASGGSKNRVVYGPSCTPMYIATTPEVFETSNLSDGEQTGGAYTESERILENRTYTGASKIKVEVDYGITGGTAQMIALDGTWDGDWDNWDSAWDSIEWIYNDENISGTKTYMIEGDTVTVFADTWGTPTSGYDYGFYIKVYPIYSTAQSGTEETSICSGLTNITGTYSETTTWMGKWYITNNNETTFLNDETAVINYLKQNSALLGTNVNIYAYNPYTIIYNGNNATAGTMTGFTTKMDTTSSTADLMAPNFKRTGYGFAGWSEEANATVNSSSKIYGPNEKVLGSDLNFNSSTHETTLYAVWVPTNGNIQNFSCSSLGSNQITALTDTRDDNVYTVGKMQDGNCWMMENMRLDNTATISSTNTNSPISTFTALSATNDSWCTNNNAACYDQFMLNTNNTNIGGSNASGTTLTVAPGLWNGAYRDDEQSNAGNNNHSQWYGYGNYYNWYAATAGNGTYSQSSGNAAGDICPTGWTLPTGGQFSNLDIAMGGTGSYQYDNGGEEIVSNRWRSYPNNFIYSGNWGGSSADVRGNFGFYWSRSASSNFSAYNLVFNSSYVTPTGLNNKNGGLSARCLAQ